MEASNFFSRLLKQPKSIEQVLEVDDIGEFDKAWRSIQDTLEHPDERQLIKGIQSTEVPKNLAHVVDALVHESNQTDEDTLGGCMEYFVNHDLLCNLERLSNQDKPHGIKSEVLKALNNLIVLLPDRFLVHNSVHRPLRRLLRSCIGDQQEEGEAVNGSAKALGAAALEGRGGEVEEDLVDLMCVLCSRMRAYPPLLLIFFHDKGWLQPEQASETTSLAPTTQSLSTRPPSTSTRGRNFEFLLFSYLLRFIHREGKTGDFARAGLLFLFDIAFHTNSIPTAMRKASGNVDDDSLLDARRALAGYILDGDFTDVMAASLGAVWSLLPSKLRVPTLGELGEEDTDGVASSGGMVLGADGHDRGEKEEDTVRSSTDQDVQEQLGMMINLFGFLQHTMIRCIPIISDQGGFDTDSDLESDSETGSGPPKPTPIIQIGMALVDSASDSIQSSFLENVLYPSILECSPQDGSSVAIMTYLDILFANLDDGPLQERLLTFLLPWNQMRDDQDQDMERFTMRDLIVDNIQSGHSQASAAGLRLFKTMMTEHCSASSGRLLEMVLPDYTPDQRIPTNSNEDGMYSSLITQLDPSCQLDNSTSYASYLADTHSIIQSDDCFGRYQYVRSGIENGPPTGKYRFEPDNPMLQILLRSLGRMLCQGPDENVTLTGVIVTMALCPFRSLEGWLTHEMEVDPLAGLDTAENPFTSTEKKAEPAIFQILSSLTSQIKSFKERIPNFDTLLSERRQGLLYTDNIDEAMNVMLDVESSSVFGSPTPALPTTPQPKKKGVMGTLASYLTPVRLSSPSTANSPGPVTPQRRPDLSDTTTSSYKAHYESLAGQKVEAIPSPVRNGIWSSPVPGPSVGSSLKRPGSSMSSRPGSSLATTTNTTNTHSHLSEPITLDQDKDNEDEGDGEREREKEKTKVALSDTLDNCVILEEFIKELVSVIAARKALGIDPVSFL